MRVVVTGGGGAGMGAAAVRMLVEQGAEVHVLDFKEPPVEVASHQAADLADREAIEAAAAAIPGSIDALFNCAGVAGSRFSDLDTVLINFVGVRHLTDLLVPRMPAGSAVATIASAAGATWPQQLQKALPLVQTEGFAEGRAWCEEHLGEFEHSYVVSKEAICIWTQHACVDLGAKGIRINCTMPGPTRTPLSPAFDEATGKEFWENFPIPVGRHAEPEEQAQALLFLNSRAASCITGVPLPDGGTISGATVGSIPPEAFPALPGH